MFNKPNYQCRVPRNNNKTLTDMSLNGIFLKFPGTSHNKADTSLLHTGRNSVKKEEYYIKAWLRVSFIKKTFINLF